MGSNFDPRQGVRGGAQQQILYGAAQPQPVLHGGHPQMVLVGGTPPQQVIYGRGPPQPVLGATPSQHVLYGASPQPVFRSAGPPQPVYYGATPPQPVYHGGAPPQPVYQAPQQVLHNVQQPAVQVGHPPRPFIHGGTPPRPLQHGSGPTQTTAATLNEISQLHLQKDDKPDIVVSHIDPAGIIWVQVCFSWGLRGEIDKETDRHDMYAKTNSMRTLKVEGQVQMGESYEN